MFIDYIYERNRNLCTDAIMDYRKLRALIFKKREEKINSICDCECDCANKKQTSAASMVRDGFITLAVLNGPNNLEDMFSAYKQIMKSNYKPPYDYTTAQHPFSFFRGTILNKYVNPLSEDCISKNLSKWLIKQDITLWDGKLRNTLAKILKISEKERIPTTIKSIYYTEEKHKYIKANQFKSASKFGEITARALVRTPKIGVVVDASLEAMQAVKMIREGGDIETELTSAALRTVVSTTAVGYLGAIGSKKYGSAGSLVGMAAGTVIGKGFGQLLLQQSAKLSQ